PQGPAVALYLPGAGSGTGNFGRFPFVGVQANEAKDHSLITVMVARPKGNTEKPVIEIEEIESGWTFRADDVKGLLDTSDRIPEVFF
ncbi:MAG: hypothetical protein HN763_07365, partial [Opitutales bacterium]|nr:hypothetical protein [Opitutales bacterium]